MTRQEAIDILKSKMDGSIDTSYEWAEAIRMAIQALKQPEPCEDTISRQAAIEAIKKVDYVIVYNVAMTQEEVIDAATDTLIAALTRDIEELPSAQPERNCEDCRFTFYQKELADAMEDDGK